MTLPDCPELTQEAALMMPKSVAHVTAGCISIFSAPPAHLHQ